jgi:signal transduction histidine kinase/HAMP domain-containing protein
VNRSGQWNPAAWWRRLTLWPRLAIGVTIGFLGLFAGFSLLGIRAVDASTNRILHERLAITEELAEDFDGLLEHRFSDLRAYDARPSSATVRKRLLAEVYHAGGGAFTAVVLLDRNGRPVDSMGPAVPSIVARLTRTGYVAHLLAGGGRAISAPFRDSRGAPVVALGVRIAGRAALVGTLDLAGPDVMERLDAARRLGTTGHAELVGPDGIALASTEPGATLVPGEHLAFYREMLKRSKPGIANVPVTPDRREPSGMGHTRHTMAFVRLAVAPWAVALGGTESETYAPAHHLRQTLILAGGGSLAALWLLTLFGARLLVRPVRDLTRAAEQMASGDLERTVTVSEGGEIGVLAESLETMRAQLKDSLETVRRWGEELELKVADRTAELNARNRQLAAVSAILVAANETHDLEGMLRRCLDVVLEQTGMEAAAVRLTDGADAVARGTWSEFPGEPPATFPLRGPSGDLGVLALGPEPTQEERPILSAISDQIAVAVENTRLAAELRRLEAQHEVQRMRNELISAVSHELRTPLGFIKGYATTLLREDTPIEPATRRHFLEIIDEETEKLEHMIGELLDVSRLQAGRLSIDREPVALGELVRHAVDKARPTLESSGHAATVSLPDEDVTVLADALRIEQVLDNLLENAVRYSDPDSPVEIALSAEDGHAVLSVTDHGDGIVPAELEQIFEPFYRGRNARERSIRGAGLGLAICRGIVEAHGGKIWGESGHDRTTTFVLTLPLAGGSA